MNPMTVPVPRLPVGDSFDASIEWLRNRLEGFFDVLGAIIGACVEGLTSLLAHTSATQFTLLACAVIAVGLLRRGHLRPVGTAVAVWAGLYIAELAGGAATAAVGSMPAALFSSAMSLYQAEYVYPPLVLALLLLTALVVLSFTYGRGTRQELLAALTCVALFAITLAHFTLGVQLSLVVLPLFVLLAYMVVGWRVALFTVLGFLLIISMDKWENAMSSLALILVATGVAIVVSLPLGILAAYSDRFSTVVRPVLDFMQTLPAFVYLLPAVAFFSIGAVPGVIATVVFAMPPGVRLTELGIRQVDKELVEAGEAFGAPDWAILRRIQLPLALSTIMAGVNQIIMLSLSMVVIAGMVGAGGLGNDVYRGIAQGNVPVGFEGGIAVVVLAIYLDRLTAAITRFSPAGRAAAAAR
ncbi:ABC transporter permease [Nocardiopsis suaedae]|uniref:ABC transporter permease subunit n=1 Tax=Nocardiopsis suaedae TaxID=3018444 RepID=A0ABT4TH47_9ACTN|nr:ABC transporter permease subunit [Nocardiopsis suaedae]MDA2803397.1 ABC transporter permease subunit [Nocardiopsis suaedae]